MSKSSSSDATGVAPSGLGCAAWRLGVRCQVIKENQRSLKRMAPSEKCDPAKQKRSGRGSGKHVASNDEEAITASMGIKGAFALGGTCPLPSGLEVAAHGAK